MTRHTNLDELPALPDEHRARPKSDWLIDPSSFVAGAFRGSDDREIVLSNGLISRTWRLSPNAATVGYDNLVTGEAIIRAVRPEAIVELDGGRYDVGGLVGADEQAYMRREWIDALTADPAAFTYSGHTVGPTVAPFGWKRVRHAPDAVWPPAGVRLTLTFEPPSGVLDGVAVDVSYELYDGIPLLCTAFELRNRTGRPVRVNSFISEILAAVEYESSVQEFRESNHPGIHVESDYALADISATQPRETTCWLPDPDYTTQVNFYLQTPCLLHSKPPRGPNVFLPDGEDFASFRTFELVHDSTDRERQGLALRRMYRTVAPWVQENPILMHVRQSDPDSVRLAVDQCAEVGFEMVAMTFWSDFDIENEDPAYIEQIRQLVEYANGRGVELGGYSLLASRHIDDENDAINPETNAPGGAAFDHAPCLESEWGHDYFRKLYAFIEKTGLNLFEHDGSYAGDWCASTSHPGHEGLDDSQWRQWERIRDLYRWCRERGVSLNVPDWYFLNGSSKTGMGYREVNWSLPRERQVLLARQNMYDGTWKKTPTMGWMFLPLVEYQGGGAEATLEPLEEHLDTYEAHLTQNFGYGIQACYRGPRLYDTDETKAVVKRSVDFYREHRAILDSDVIHVRRPDGRDIDAILHVNPRLSERGLLMVFNPLDEPVRRTLNVPLYYTGIANSAAFRAADGTANTYTLDRDYRVELPVEIEAGGRAWYVIEAADD